MFRYFKLFLIIIIFSNCVSTKSGIDSQYMVNILEFGAQPNDNQDDSEAIQNAIDFAIKSNKSSRVFCPPGVYLLDKGLVIARSQGNGEYGFVTLTIGGGVATYARDQNIGKVVVFKMNKPTFGLALQSARNCIIENIVFEGCAKFSNDPKDILNMKTITVDKTYNIIKNSYSPSCAIVIDPFHKNISTLERYKDHETRYTNVSTGGSSMVLIKGCSFFQHYIAIANNPSANVQNGDNIRAENCHVTTCHTFWSAGQTQSRGNSIENVYALFLHTFVSGTQIGSHQGTPPIVSNLNLAGFCKFVFDIKTGFSGLNVYRSYMESIWSLGVTNGISTSFDQCQIQFYIPDEKITTPPFHIYSDRIVSLRDCNIEYFNNCNSPIPFLFKSQELIISGGSIEGGVIVADGITNDGGDDLHKVQMLGVFIKCLGKVAGRKSTQKPDSKVKDEIILGGEILISNEGNLALNRSTTYNLQYLETKNIDRKDFIGKIVFNSENPSVYKKGDNIFSDQVVNLSELNIGNYSIRTYLGYVDRIENNVITILGTPFGVKNGDCGIYKVSFPKVDLSDDKLNQNKEIIRYIRK